MRTLFCFLLIGCFLLPARAQQSYFIYLESESGQPFYVKMDDRIYSSMSPGYLVLPQMADSTYQLLVGFSSARRSSKFQIPVGTRDRGFLIRQSGDVPQLTDLQSSSIVSALPDPLANVSYTRRTDPFTLLLSKAARDSDILFVPVAMPVIAQAKKPDPAPERPKTETETPKDPAFGDSIRLAVSTPPVVPSPDTVVVSSRDTTAALVLTAPPDTLVQRSPAVMDTLALVARPDTGTLRPPSDVAVQPTPSADSTAMANNPSRTDSIGLISPAIDSSVVTVTPVRSADSSVTSSVSGEPATGNEPGFQRSRIRKYAESSTSEGFGLVYIDITPEGADTIRLIIPNPLYHLKVGATDTLRADDPELFLKRDTPAAAAAPVLPAPKRDCSTQAGESDFLKLRRNMVGRSSEEDMVEEARKYFRKMCFTTSQIRSLGALFLTDAGKYLFYDAAYLHVSDAERFPGLGTEIRDSYYSNRFKALVGQ